jgi:hypothetical protein
VIWPNDNVAIEEIQNGGAEPTPVGIARRERVIIIMPSTRLEADLGANAKNEGIGQIRLAAGGG